MNSLNRTTPRLSAGATMIMWAARLRRLPFWLLPALALLALAAGLLWLTPAETAQAQDGSAATITTGPVITSSPASGDTYGKGETIVVAVTFSKSVTVTGEPRVRLAMGERKRWARYSGGSGGATLTFAYTVRATTETTTASAFPRTPSKPTVAPWRTPTATRRI